MYETTITSQGTISIPAPLRKKYALKPGEKLIVEDSGKIIISKAPNIDELRRINKAALKGKKVPVYKSGDGFAAHVLEKYGKT